MRLLSLSLVVFLLLPTLAGQAAERQFLRSHLPAALTNLNLPPLGRLTKTNRLHLAIGLPLRNEDALTSLLDRLYDPTSTNFHRYLTPDAFTEHFGPTPENYQAVVNFARTNGFEVVTHSDRVLIDVHGKVEDIERAFHIALRLHQHPMERRRFFCPDTQPSVDASLPLFEVTGLDDYVIPHPTAHLQPLADGSLTAAGTAPNGSSFMGKDFRNAYASGVTLNGSGQIVGLVEGDGYYLSDITNYESLAGLPNVPLQNLLGSLSGIPSSSPNGVGEVSLDIEMVISMAPGLAKVMIWEDNIMEDILSSMVLHTEVKQFSSSWTFEPATPSSLGYLKQMAAQGQSFFQASGDGDSYTQPIAWPSSDLFVTSVGGTTLTMNGLGASYSSETVWNSGFQSPAWGGNGSTSSSGGYWGSGGGPTTYPIPNYQKAINMAAVGGSAVLRCIPDVAMTANNVWVIYLNGQAGAFQGTSCAAPLWAGFTALVNQQGANLGRPSVGFLNPAIYSIASGPQYSTCFHDITSGNNAWPGNPGAFSAAPGYDLCTGLGTPNGQNLINALAPFGGFVWVDFNFGGTPQDGSYANPFNTLALGTNAVSSGGTVAFETAGSSPERMTISKPMTIRAVGGAVSIGH